MRKQNGHGVKGYGYDRLMADLVRLREQYAFVRVEFIGESVLGRPIPAVRIGSGGRKIHYNAAFHANEWITSMFMMAFAADYAAAVESGGLIGGRAAADLFASATLYAVPMVNPDGVDLVLNGVHPAHPYGRELLRWNGGNADFSGWKANIRGVDLNDQFPAYWEAEQARRGQAGPGPRDFGGPAPLSEPEAAAMAEYTRLHGFDLVIAFHTQGREIYWNYRGLEPRISRRIADKLAAASGYCPVELTGSDAGYKDWFIREFRRPGFTVEAGCGTNPLPVSQFAAVYREVRPLMALALDEDLFDPEAPGLES